MRYFKCGEYVGCYSDYLISLVNEKNTTEEQIVSCLKANLAPNEITGLIRDSLHSGGRRKLGAGREIPCGARLLLQSELYELADGSKADVGQFTAFGDFEVEMYTLEVWNFVESTVSGDDSITTGELARLEKAVINAARKWRDAERDWVVTTLGHPPADLSEELLAYDAAHRALVAAVKAMDEKE